jgi:hypothetical protein
MLPFETSDVRIQLRGFKLDRRAVSHANDGKVSKANISSAFIEKAGRASSIREKRARGSNDQHSDAGCRRIRKQDGRAGRNGCDCQSPFADVKRD